MIIVFMLLLAVFAFGFFAFNALNTIAARDDNVALQGFSLLMMLVFLVCFITTGITFYQATTSEGPPPVEQPGGKPREDPAR